MLKVGEIAARTGVTVRTLHHWDPIGLLTPRQRTRAGHRLYGDWEVERLQRILSLRDVGFSLPQIERALSDPERSLADVLERHIEQLKGRIEREQALCARLEGVHRVLQSTGSVSADSLLQLM